MILNLRYAWAQLRAQRQQSSGGAKMNDLVDLRHVSKSYGPVQALQDVSFGIRAGEVHALLGENGAGKSTTMRVVRGETAPTSGEVLVDGKKLTRFSPSVSDDLGIAMVHQELSIFNGLTVAENLAPDLPTRTWAGFVNRRKLNDFAAEKLNLFNLNIRPEQPMSSLTTGQKQIVEILRAISDSRRLIILDEPTSSLNAQEAETLLALIKSLRADGKSVLFVSHRIPEVLEISDRVTVLRDGKFIETLDNYGLSEADLVQRMVGRDMGELHARRQSSGITEGAIAFGAKGLSGVGGLSDVSLDLRQGEVLGIFGLEGSGAGELSRLLFGLDVPRAGDVQVKGNTIANPTPLKMIEAGVTYLSPDRSDAGLFKFRSLSDNITAPVLSRLSKMGLIRREAVRETSQGYSNRFSIKAGGLASTPASLSGGNQQKVMMAACLTPGPEVVIANEPTRGVDVGAKAEMHRKLVELAESGTSVLVFSSELPELVSLCDRVIVMRSNRIAGELSAAPKSPKTAQ